MAQTASKHFMKAIRKSEAEDFNRDFSDPPRIGKLTSIPVVKPWTPDEVADKGGYQGLKLAHQITADDKRQDGNARKPDDSTPTRGFYLIPQGPLNELARVYQIGAEKYAPRGWEEGMSWAAVLDGLYRHLGKWINGETNDAVDGQHHLASIAWRALALMEYENTHPELDDVHPKPKPEPGMSYADADTAVYDTGPA